MAKKRFFNNKVHNKKRTITNLIIIGGCLIGIIMSFIITTSFTNKSMPKKEVNINPITIVEINEDFNNEIFFSEISNVNINDFVFNYPNNFSKEKIGTYTIEIIINENKYETTLKIVDTKKPELKVKNVTINKNGRYSANDFVESCTDNSGENCQIAFYTNATDEDLAKIDYSTFKDSGIYEIKISAKDSSNNEIIETASLTIKDDNNNVPTIIPQNCKYGNNEYDSKEYLIAIDVTNNGCAVSLDLYKSQTYLNDINKIIDNETTKIQKEINKFNLKGTLSLNRSILAVVNKSEEGIIGYELSFTVSHTENDKDPKIIAQYKIDKDGKRHFTINKYNLK